MIVRLAVASILAATVGFSSSRQPPTRPPAGTANAPATAATRPMVERVEMDIETFAQEVLAQAPAELREDSGLAMAWMIRKTMRDGTPQQREEMLGKLKGILVSAVSTNKELDRPAAALCQASCW